MSDTVAPNPLTRLLLKAKQYITRAIRTVELSEGPESPLLKEYRKLEAYGVFCAEEAGVRLEEDEAESESEGAPQTDGGGSAGGLHDAARAEAQEDLMALD